MATDNNWRDSLNHYIVSKAPPTLYYIPDFINKEEEQYLLKHVYDAPKPKWQQLSNRRLQNWGGLPHEKGMVAEPLPMWLQSYTKKVGDLGVFGDSLPNHVLVNEYEAGQGIMPHEDGPFFHPVVSTITLGSHTLLNFYYHLNRKSETSAEQSTAESLEDRHFVSVLLQPRSLVLVLDDMYKTHLHGISETTEDIITDKVLNIPPDSDINIGTRLVRSRRVSLTIRNVPHVIKRNLFFGKR